jgi:hypothetical protein
MSPVYDSLSAVTRELYDKVHAVNASGPFRLSALVGERMAAGAGGSIINVTTAGSLRPGGFDLPYAMAKAGLNALTLALAGEWAPKVRANLVLPGAFDTDISKAWGPEAQRNAAEMNPMKRIGAPEDLVGVCIFLANLPGQRRLRLHQRRPDPRRRRPLPHPLGGSGQRRCFAPLQTSQISFADPARDPGLPGSGAEHPLQPGSRWRRGAGVGACPGSKSGLRSA